MSRRSLAFLLVTLFPLAAWATPPPDIDAWLGQNPEIANALVWEFPDVLPELPIASKQGRIGGSWMQRASAKKPLSSKPTTPDPPALASCPALLDLPTPGKILRWCQWPQSYRDRLKDHFNTYWNWMEDSWTLYRPYKDGRFLQKPPGFDERFGSTLDPETGTEPGTLPFAAVVVKKTSNGIDFHYVLFDPAAAFDLYLKTITFQLVLDRGAFLNWKLADYGEADLSVVLDGRSLFQYVPAGQKFWGTDVSAPDKEGYWPSFQLPAPPLVLMKFLMRKGLLRDSRFETVSEFFEWERLHLLHGGSNLYDMVGGCDDDFNEIQWGFKGPPPLTSVLHGRPLTCTSPPMGYDGELSPYEIHPDHNIQGCITSGPVRHKVMRQINVAAENFCYKGGHCSTRFVVERTPLEQMLARVEPSLPSEPAIDDDRLVPASLDESLFADKTLSPAMGASVFTILPPQTSKSTAKPRQKITSLANAYLDHNDNPYSLWGYWEIPAREALISEATFRRWFPEIPEGLTPEQEKPFVDAHQKRVSLRMNQLVIGGLPLRLFQFYCHYHDEEKAPYETKIYEYFLSKYRPEELEKAAFWPRFHQKYEALGGCPNIPSLEFRGFPSD